MKRREFLAAMPWAVEISRRRAGGRDPSTSSVSIAVLGSPHPRVWRSVEQLIRELRELDYSVKIAEGVRPIGSEICIVVGVPDKSNWQELRQAGWESQTPLLPEHFELTAKPGLIFALGGDSRGLIYALSQLHRSVRLERRLPSSLVLRREPLFAIRRWSAAVSHNFGSPWDERIHLAQRLAYIKSEILPRAADYGMNSIELNGRPGDGWDIDWVICYEKYPELASLVPTDVRRERLDLIEDLARAAHSNLLEILVWNHELHLPAGFTDLYPEVKGTEYPVCLSSEFLKQFIRDKYIEFFTAAPSIDGVVISVNESGQFSLVTDAGCKCDRCIKMKQHDRLLTVLNEVIAVTSKLKKQIILRTFQSASIHDLHGHPELEIIRKAYTGLPNHVQIMSKYCPLDFYGGQIADEPLIGVFPNSHLVEFSLDVEWQGRTFVPVLTPENFRRRVAHATEKKCSGIVARVDFPFPSMEPEPIFGHPNEFNAWYMGELLWNRDPNIEDSLVRWAQLRYGANTPPEIAAALRKTEAITQKTFFALGHTLINYHNMLAGVSFCDNALWNHALSKWDPEKRKLSESFFQPDEDLIARTKREKEEAIELAAEGLSEIHQARQSLSEVDYHWLGCDFEKLKNTAELWGHLLELYLRHRQISFSPVKPEWLRVAVSRPNNEPLERLLAAAQAALRKAIEMENRHGNESWPVVSPDRGVSTYEFVSQVLRHYIGGTTGEVVDERIVTRFADQIVTAPVYQSDSTENLWRKLVECGRPGFEFGSSTEVSLKWPDELHEVEINGFDFNVTSREGHSLRFPLTYPVRAISLANNSDSVFVIRKTARDLWIDKKDAQTK